MIDRLSYIAELMGVPLTAWLGLLVIDFFMRRAAAPGAWGPPGWSTVVPTWFPRAGLRSLPW
ncbi:hypothetical protein [Streptomyces sp. NPDC058457]|uniref:hypothetical protein n=1 Tax=Streptomyces sp. NPDC058457 TaxID=3346507 RepID=UPI00364DBA09